MNTRRSFLATLAFGVASIAAGALKYVPEPIRKSKLFGALDGSVGQWSGRVIRRNYLFEGRPPLASLFDKLKEGEEVTSTYNWFERDPKA